MIAELFLEGAPLFSLSQLFKYRRGEFDPTAMYLHKIEDPEIRVRRATREHEVPILTALIESYPAYDQRKPVRALFSWRVLGQMVSLIYRLPGPPMLTNQRTGGE